MAEKDERIIQPSAKAQPAGYTTPAGLFLKIKRRYDSSRGSIRYYYLL
jgi:hypothetical protein